MEGVMPNGNAQSVRVGVIGIGMMGMQHAGYLANHGIEGASLAAICGRNAERLETVGGQFPAAARFTDYRELLASQRCDAVLIVTPHVSHPEIVLAAFEAGVHVLVEKPLAVGIGAAREVVAAYARYPRLKFGIMFNQRTHPLHQKIREIVRGGELGAISRVTWIATHWFRTDAYYASSPWRATWEGEGGGVSINQCPHNLDLLLWMTGLRPTRVTAVGFAGKTHPIETEDELSAIVEFADVEGGKKAGAIGHFVTTTGEFPGTNRLEIAGSRGKLVSENGVLTVTRVKGDVREFCRSSPQAFGVMEMEKSELSFSPPKDEHRMLTADFVAAIREGRGTEGLLAPGPEGVGSLELGNAILYSGLGRKSVELPLAGEEFEAFLRDQMAKGNGAG